jgi:hypothetical protein
LVLHRTQRLIYDSQLLLYNITQNEIQLSDIQQLNIWSLSNTTQFSFIDLIKGIIPTTLYSIIHQSLTSKEATDAAMSSLMHFIFVQSNDIWKDRCSQFKDFEKSHEITDQLKRSLTENSGYHFSSSTLTFMPHNVIDQMVRLGSQWTNFWCCRGQALFCF